MDLFDALIGIPLLMLFGFKIVAFNKSKKTIVMSHKNADKAEGYFKKANDKYICTRKGDTFTIVKR
jgi:hypothetical protein